LGLFSNYLVGAAKEMRRDKLASRNALGMQPVYMYFGTELGQRCWGDGSQTMRGLQRHETKLNLHQFNAIILDLLCSSLYSAVKKYNGEKKHA